MTLLTAVRRTLAGGGLRPLIACAVIGWGITELTKLAEEREAQLDALGELLQERRAELDTLLREAEAAQAAPAPACCSGDAGVAVVPEACPMVVPHKAHAYCDGVGDDD